MSASVTEPALAPKPAIPLWSGSTWEAELALHATALRWLLDRQHSHPARWRTRPFERTLRVVRGHLAPIRSRELLASSFGREAGRREAMSFDEAVASLGASEIHVAYAVRWMELGGEAIHEEALQGLL